MKDFQYPLIIFESNSTYLYFKRTTMMNEKRLLLYEDDFCTAKVYNINMSLSEEALRRGFI